MRRAALAALCALLSAIAQPARADVDRHAPQTGASETHAARPAIAARAARPRAGQAHAGVASEDLGGRPAECHIRIRGRLIPFCGCALSVKLFGRVIPALMLAANWRDFPPAAPAPDMVAARRGHVFLLVRHVEGDTWIVWDANSGRGRIRMHARRLVGFSVHNPRAGSRYATAG